MPLCGFADLGLDHAHSRLCHAKRGSREKHPCRLPRRCRPRGRETGVPDRHGSARLTLELGPVARRRNSAGGYHAPIKLEAALSTLAGNSYTLTIIDTAG